jgi:hypothetical protein
MAANEHVTPMPELGHPYPPFAATDSVGWPEPIEFIRQLRRTVGLFDGAMPITPKQAWEEALDRVRVAMEGHPMGEHPSWWDWRCPSCDGPVR